MQTPSVSFSRLVSLCEHPRVWIMLRCMCALTSSCLHIFAYMCMLCLDMHECVCVGEGASDSWLLVIHDDGCCSVQQCEGDSHWSLCGRTANLGGASEGHSWAESTSTLILQLLTSTLAIQYNVTHSCT